jgi:hypothetical protein
MRPADPLDLPVTAVDGRALFSVAALGMAALVIAIAGSGRSGLPRAEHGRRGVVRRQPVVGRAGTVHRESGMRHRSLRVWALRLAP